MDNTNGNLVSANESNPQSVSQAVPNGAEDNEGTSLRYRLSGDRTSSQSSDGNVTQIQRDLRTGSSGTIDLSEFQPGAMPVNETQQTHPLLQEIETSINEADAVIDEADGAIVDDIATDILDAESIIQEASIAVTGEPELVISDAEKLIDKACVKLITELEDDLREAYSYMSSIGIPVPTDEEIAYAEATGDYLGYISGTIQGDMGVPSAPTETSGLSTETQTATQAQNAPQGQPQPAVNVPSIPVSRDTPAGPPSVDCQSQLGPNAQIIGAYGAIEACNNTNRCAVEITQPYSEANALQVIQTIMAANNGLYNGPIVPLPATGEYMGLLGDGNYQVQWITSWSSYSGPFWGMIGGPTGSYNGPIYQVLVPVGWHCQIDPSTGVVYAVNENRPDWCGLQQRGSPDTYVPTTPPTPGDTGGGKCPPPSKPDCPTTAKPGNLGNIVTPAGKTDCEFLQDVVDGFSQKDTNFSDLIGMGTSAALDVASLGLIRAITGSDQPIIPSLIKRFADWVNEMIKATATVGNCDRTAMVPLAMNNAAMAFVQKWTAIIPPQYIELMRQVSNTACQQNMPNGGGANEAWLNGEIDDKEWECWQKLNGNIIDAAKKVAHGERSRLNPRELDILFRRSVIDWDDYLKRMRERGVVEDADRIAIHNLNEHWPAQSEIIRLMNRDVFNQQTAEKSKLFDGFDDNYTDDARKYGDALGIPKDLMKLYWGAHWQLPSYTMAKEFLYRFNGGDNPENVKFTEEDFRQLLKQDDWAPGHIDRMIAAAYHPVSKRDAILAYMIHASTDEEFFNQLIKVGYAKDNAGFMQQYYKKRREIADRKASGYPTMRTAVNAYARCELAESEFTEIVGDIAIDDDQTKAAIKAAKVSRKVWERKQTIRTVKRPFILGIYDVSKATQELSDADVDPGCVDDLIKQWNRERLRRDKYLTASQLCDMFEKGLIGPQQYAIALVRTGWSEEDASMIVTNCGIKISEKFAERVRREAEKAARLLKQQQKEAEKAARLAECGPPPCPANRQRNTHPAGAGP